jgi:hypothetical protein
MSTEPPRAPGDDPAVEPAVIATVPPLPPVSVNDAPAEISTELPLDDSPLVVPAASTTDPLMSALAAPVAILTSPDDAASPVEMICAPDEPLAPA